MGSSLEEQGRLDQETSRGIALALLPLMPPGWRVEMPSPAKEYAYWAYLVHRTGASIMVRVGGWRNEGRVKFQPCWPTYADGRTYSTPPRYTPTKWDGRDWRTARMDAEDWSITVSAKRAPKAMASELARRLLPAYEVMHAVAVEETRDTNAHTDEAGVVAKSLATVVGGSIVESSYKTHEQQHIRAPGMVVHRLRVHPHYGGARGGQPCRVDFEVHGLDPETAARCLALIREAEERADEAQGEAARARVAELGPGIRIGPIDEEVEPESEPLERAATSLS